MLQKQVALVVALGYGTGQISVVLLCIYVAYQSFLCFEVERHGVALVFVASHVEDGGAKFLAKTIHRACGVYQTAVEAHEYLVALQVHVLIGDVRFSIQIGVSAGCLVGQRVFGRIEHRGINTVFPPAVGTVGCQ